MFCDISLTSKSSLFKTVISFSFLPNALAWYRANTSDNCSTDKVRSIFFVDLSINHNVMKEESVPVYPGQICEVVALM